MSQDINLIIEQLADIDSASASIMQKAQKEKAAYAEQIHQQQKKFDGELQSNIDKEVQSFQSQMDEQNAMKIAQYRADCNSEIQKLDKLFETDGSKWADEIFKEIIKE